MTNYFNQICEFRQKYPVFSAKAIKTNNPILNDVKKALNNLKLQLEKKYLKFEGIDLRIEVSKGAANFPNISHICILPPNQKVSNGIYVAICFDKSGKGAVIGCAESKTNPKGLNIKIRKQARKIPEIDIDGGSSNTKYNNVYENPKEFYYALAKDSEIENHINKSLSLCLYNLKLINTSQYLHPNDYLNSTVNEREIDYFDMNNVIDDRKKIAIQIHARRGQKKFRNKLLNIYNSKCAFTDCEITDMLEAAHIFSFKGSETNKIQNGILMRTDIHTLFDLGLISVDPENYLIQVSDKILTDTYYAQMHNKILSLPNILEGYPDKNALKYHFENVFN
ncbi:HNH endonuclease [Chryseobacterium sp. C3]|uniref:HNH endonuclease n=1 Tax=Chryseobacterium sp. C3 TaxID=2761532 RepID=UPI00162ABEE4|nr:HNH endonuclease [Chryseobacterium sp. C3]